MPRMDPLGNKNVQPSHHRRDRQEPIRSFLHDLFFPTNQPSELLMTEGLLEAISPVWEMSIVPTLVSEFGKGSTLYAIFYAPDTHKKEVILEIWDPNYVETKPSQVFELKGIPNIAKLLPSKRFKAQIITLNNWH